MLISTDKLDNIYKQTQNREVNFEIILEKGGLHINAIYREQLIARKITWEDIIQNRMDIIKKTIEEMENDIIS